MKRKLLLGFCLIITGFGYGQENIVDVFFETPFTVDAEGFYRFSGQGIRLAFDAKDENGDQVPASTLANYELILNTKENTNLNTAIKGVDFEAITDLTLSIPTNSGDVDDTRTLTPLGDQIFEADEFFFIEVTTNDPNITLKNAVNGVVQFPIRIVDNELTDIELEVIQNGAEPDQKARLRMTSSFQNNLRSNETGEPLLFDVMLSGGDAVINEDYAPFMGQVSIENGASIGEFEIDILNNDAIAEGLESFNVTIAYAGDLNEETERVRLVNGGTIPVTITDDGNPFVVSAIVTGAGAGPNYTVMEGDEFSIQFNALTNQEEGQTFSVPFTLGGTATADDFVAPISPGSFTVNSVNDIDGSLNFTIRIDTFDDNGDILQINIPKPLGDFEWENANLDGSLSFQITTTERTEPIRIGVSIFESSTEISPSSLTTASEPVYTFIEGNRRLFFRFKALDLNSNQLSRYTMDVVTPASFGSATPNLDYGPIDSFINMIVVDNDFDELDSGSDYVDISDDNSREFTEHFAVELDPNNPLISFVELNNGVEGLGTPPGEKYRFWIDIKDNENVSEPFILKPTLSSNVSGGPGNYSIVEGEELEISFKALSPAPLDFKYKVAYQSEGSATLDDDYNWGGTVANTGTLTVTSETSDGNALFQLFDNDGPDPGENLVLRFPPDPEGIYTWENADPTDGSLTITLAINETEVYDGGVFNMITNVVGANRLDAIPELEYNELYEIGEGKSFEITINDVPENTANGFSFELPWGFSGAISSANFNIEDALGNTLPVDNENLEFIVNSSNDYEIKIKITLDDNDVLEPDKEFFVRFKTGAPDDSDIAIQNASSTDAAYRYKFIVKDNDTASGVFTSFTNLGGREGSGEKDIFTISLKNPDGSYYKNISDTSIKIPVEYNVDGVINPIDFEDVSPKPLPSEFLIMPNDSTATIELEYLDEEDENDTESNYFNLVLKEAVATIDIAHPMSSFEIKVLDKNTVFSIDTDFTGNVQRRDVGGEDCCYWYQVEEGEDIQFRFDAEKGIANTTPYLLNIDIDDSEYFPNPSMQTTLEDGDFTLATTSFENIPRSVKPGIDNFLNMRIAEGDYSTPKRFRVVFAPPAVSNYVYSSSRDRDSDEKSVSFDFVIVEATPTNIVVTKKEVREEDESLFAEVKIQVVEALELGTKVEFLIKGSATPGVDYRLESDNILELNDNDTGVIYWGQDQLSATIKIYPIDEDTDQQIAEIKESVTFELVDGFGYALGDDLIASVDITDRDPAKFTASLSTKAGEGTIYEDASLTPNEGDFIISLNEVNDSDEPITVNFEFSMDADTRDLATLGDDYRVFVGDMPNQIDITDNDIKSVSIPKNSKSANITIKTFDEGSVESPESVVLRILDGFNYRSSTQTNAPEITIISKDQNTTTVDFSLVTVIVKSATCPGVNEGDIAMINGTPFDFKVILNNSEGMQVGQNTLAKNTVNETVMFKDLASGAYEVKISFDATTDVPDDIIAPIYNLVVRELGGAKLTAKSINYGAKSATLELFGSTYYKIENGGASHEFHFQDSGKNTATIPLNEGLNTLRIKSEAACQGILEESVYFKNYIVYPNPVQDVLYLFGVDERQSVDIQISDSSGRIVYDSKVTTAEQELGIDISDFPKGIYFADFTLHSQNSVRFKIIKK